ncbi:MAG: choice-of-anchor D domain-containing protein [Terracidiphilus sp.]
MTKACSVYLSTAASSNTFVTLSSNNAAIWVPATVTVNAGATTAGFSAYIYAVTTAQTVIISGTSGGVSTTLTVTANPVATLPALSLSSSNLTFGNTIVNTTSNQSLTLTSTGTGPLAIDATTISGSGFTISGITFPITLNSGQTAALTVSFNPVTTGTAAGTLTISSNSSVSPSAVISLSGAGVPAVSAIACANSALLGAATSSCTVTLNAAAPAGGQAVTLSSNNAAATVPSSIIIPFGTSSAVFTVTGSSVTSTQAATLTAYANGISKSFVLQVQPAISTLGISATSVAFGNVDMYKAATASVTLTSTGTVPVTANTESLSGTGFSISGSTFPVTLTPGQSLALAVQFVPSSLGAATGQLTITSNSSTGSSIVVNLNGAGVNPTTGTTYYLAPQAGGGSDSNSGLSPNQPWLSPKHALNCGDVIIAAASTVYDSANFNSGKWGTVTCPTANNVAWLQCATFDACKISSTEYGMYVDHSFWGVQGWEVTVSAPGTGFCFGAAPQYSNPTSIHHVIFANNIANGCMAGGFTLFNVGSASVDYFILVGNIAYNAAQGSAQCYSGISVYQPVQSDSATGTHIYLAGNFSWDNFEPNTCGGVQAYGGDGIIFDTLDGSQGGLAAYQAQAVAENNIIIGNGGQGIEVQNNVAGSVHAPIILANNTAWGNEAELNQQPNSLCSELLLNSAYNVVERNNLVATKAATACVGNLEYAFAAYTVDGSVSILDNFAFAYPDQASFVYNGPNFQFSPTNVTGVNPSFENAYVPGAPACEGTENVSGCMANVMANFTPTNTAAASYGYQIPGTAAVSDPLFPQWLCSVNLPSGLTAMGCLEAN